MKIENIETNLGNTILDELKEDGWKVSAEYSPLAFDKGMDFDSYTLKRNKAKLYFKWTNWFEWQIQGSDIEVNYLITKYKLR